MNTRIILIVLALVLIIGGAAYFLMKDRGAEETPVRSYTNATYGYTFRLPEPYEVMEYTPENISVGTPNGEGFDSEVDVAYMESGGEGGYENFEAFLFERTRLLCAADGPNESLDCTRIARLRTLETSGGATGYELTLELTRLTPSTGETATSTYGPMFAFDVSERDPESAYAAIVVYQPLPTFLTSESVNLLRRIVGSFTIE